jgi:hypothetical protein
MGPFGYGDFMAHYPDLSPFVFWPSRPHMLNVGWLSRDHPFPRGSVPYAFAHELRRLCENPVEIMRGFHVCEFCLPPLDIFAADPEYEDVWQMFRAGNGEVHVTGADGLTYCAPALVIHYVSEHQYRPPGAFIQAVLLHRQVRRRTENGDQCSESV